MIEGLSLFLGTLIFIGLAPIFFKFLGPYFLPTIKGVSFFKSYPKKLDLIFAFAYVILPIIVFSILRSKQIIKKITNASIIEIKKVFDLNLTKLFSFIKVIDKRINNSFWKCLIFPLVALFKLSPLPFMDRYHFGEFVVATQLWIKGLVPYVDFIPGHGLINIIGGLIPTNDNFLINIIWGQVIVTILFALINLIVTSIVLESVLSSVLICLSLPNARPAYLILFVIGLILIKFEQSRQFWYLAMAFLLSTILLTLEVSIGTGAVASVLSVTTIFIFFNINKYNEILKFNKDRFWLIIIIFNCLLIFYYKKFFTAIILTVINLGKNNLEAFGIPFIDSLNDPKIIFLLKFLFLPIMSLILIRFIFFKEKSVILQFGFIYACTIMAYSMGRIDSMILSRPGFTSQILLSLLFVHLTYQRINKSYIFFVSLLMFIFVRIEFVNPIKSLSYLSNIKYQLQNENIAYPEAETIKKICLQNIIKNFEFLDLTNNNMSYYFCNSVPPLMASSFYNISDEKFFTRKSNFEITDLKVILNDSTKYSYLHDQVKPQDRIPNLMSKINSEKSFKTECESDFCFKIKQKINE